MTHLILRRAELYSCRDTKPAVSSFPIVRPCIESSDYSMAAEVMVRLGENIVSLFAQRNKPRERRPLDVHNRTNNN